MTDSFGDAFAGILLEGGMQATGRPIEVLLVEDNPADARLMREALKDAKVQSQISIVSDGAQALEFLRHEGKYQSAPRPDLILLDLNLPKKDGREVLAEIKNDPDLMLIPVAVLTTSQAHQDIIKAYKLHANCYITKPMELEHFARVVESFEDFWLKIVTLPPREVHLEGKP
jgi:CheY-like chemotaxis protein